MKEGKARHVDFYFDEYIAGVAGVLNAEEQGVYWMVCALIMSEGGPTTENHRRLAMLCGVRPSDIKRVVASLIKKGKIFIQTDGKLAQKRAQSEVEKSLNRIKRASEVGANGGRPRGKSKQNQESDKADGSFAEKLTTNHQPATTNQIEKEEPDGSSKKRGSRLSQDWALPDDWRAYAAGKGLQDRQIALEAEKFKNHWISQPGQRGVKVDWLATWRNWIINSGGNLGKSSMAQSGRHRGPGGDLTNDFLFARG
ncbi:DUF1376 domain-containing protein [Ensifer sp. T173]|uniref:DUF1376 domain-containing protein n=1 Tax=Ensifer canadensis TaxID=555315 RepID=A0AAW4FN71_9HYPH|nr:DUF1376 domain-containing protein [Ensifer canadensis]MBM3091595.1 DUF1376 domain-containing protein [Ensifer canadensis]UBI74420.1 YdaU family protein [Ensifer canadensis]